MMNNVCLKEWKRIKVDRLQTQKKALKAPFLLRFFAYFLVLSAVKRLLNLSTRPPVSTLRCLPV